MVDSNDAFDTRLDHSVGLSDGIASDLRGHQMGFASVQPTGWEPTNSDLRSQSRLHSLNQLPSSSRVLGLSGDPFENRLGANSNFYGVTSSSSINSKSNADHQNNIEGIFPDENGGPVWCAAPWSERLDSAHDPGAPEWCKQIQDSGNGVNSLFTQSDCDRSWRCRTASDSGRMSPHKRTSGNNRSGQNSQRRRGRTLSGGSSASNGEFDGINLPSGQVLNANDFDAAASDPVGASLRYADVSSTSAFQASIVGSKIHQGFVPSLRPGGDDSALSSGSSADLHRTHMGVIGQPLSVDDKSRILMQNSSRLWSSSAPLDAPEFCASVNTNNQYPDDNQLFNSKAYRPLTSDQFTQHDTGFRHNPGLPKTDQTGYAFDNLDNQPPDESQVAIDDEQLWFYEDPQNRIQGEFGSAQMCGWLFAGRYFTPSLRIRRKCDDTLSTLVDYIKLFGRIPFTPGPRIPPLRGPITQATIMLVRSSLALQQQQAVLAEAALNNIEANMRTASQMSLSNACGKFAANCPGDTFSKSDCGGLPISFKNGLLPTHSTTNSGAEFDLDTKQQLQQQQGLVLKQLMDTFKHGMSVNDPVYIAASSILSEMLAKSRICPTDSSSAESIQIPTSTSVGFSWPPPSTNLQSTSGPAHIGLIGMGNQSSLPMDPAIIQPSELSSIGAGVLHCVDSPFKTSRHKNKATTDHNNTSTSVKGHVENTPTERTNKGSKQSSPHRNNQQQHINCSSGTGGGNEVEVAPRSISQSGSVSSQSSQSASVWARSSDSPPENTSRRLLLHGCGGGSLTDGVPATVTTAAKSCWGGGGDNLKGKSKTKKSTNLISSNASEKSPGKLSSHSSSDCGSQKKVKSRQQPEANGVCEKTLKKGTTGKKGNISKSSGSSSGGSSNSEELINLIQWVQSALTGIELREKLDIPTFVELLTTIDAPYEVEGMLLAYIGNSSRSTQFIKEFLDRRHTCWQQHRKQLEEMHESSKSSAPSKKTTASNTITVAVNDAVTNSTSFAAATNGVYAKTYSEANDPQSDSAWQQIKPKSSSNRKGKKTKQRS